MSNCPIGLNCSDYDVEEMLALNHKECSYGNKMIIVCVNLYYCLNLASAWKLPYIYISDKKCLEVIISISYSEEDQEFSEIKEAGFSDPLPLPYYFSKDKSLVVCYSGDLYKNHQYYFNEYNGRKINNKIYEELGFLPAVELPYKYNNDKKCLNVITNNFEEYGFAKPEKIQYSYIKFSPKFKCSVLRVLRIKGGFYPTHSLNDRKRFIFKNKVVVRYPYPIPKNWLFKKDIKFRGLKLSSTASACAYYYSKGANKYIELWHINDCSSNIKTE